MKREYKNITRALDLIKQARSAFDLAEYDPLLNSLEARRVALERRIRASDETRLGTETLRPIFYYGMNEARNFVNRPKTDESMPHISLDQYNALKLILHGSDIRVDAEYDVEVKQNGVTYYIIPGRPK